MNICLVCPSECGNLSCTADGDCCHEQCLGGCAGPKQDNCFACKYLEDDQDCVKECPPGTLIVSIIYYFQMIKCYLINIFIL